MECENYRKSFGVSISGQILAERLSNYLHAHTLYGYFRPLGCEILVSSFDDGKFRLFKILHSGSFQGHFMCTGGKGQLVAKNAMEIVDLQQTVSQTISNVAYVLAKAHEEFKDKTYEMEFSIISKETNFQHELVHREHRERLQAEAQDKVDNE
jgi:20S proteasome subunit alpha 7